MFHVHGRPRLSRRQFLSAAVALAGGAIAMSPRRSLGESAGNRNEILRLALLSDTHTPHNPDNRFGGLYPYKNLQEAVGRICSDLPDGLVVTGDVARLTGNTGSYDNFKKLLSPISSKRPIHLALGNHDHRANFQHAFRNCIGDVEQVEGKHVVTADASPVRLILLDSLLWVNMFPGQLGKGQRQWLQSYLEACDERPTILFVHHTIKDGANDMMDAGKLVEIIKPQKKVKAVVFGHSHACNFAQVHGIHLINVPALGFNFSGGQPVGWIDARLTAKGGEFTVRAIAGNRRLDGHVRRLNWRT
jgi:Icc protein